MPDWITLLIEAVGVAIVGIWIVVPVQEFKSIFARLRREGHPTLADPIGRSPKSTADRHDAGATRTEDA